MHKQGHPIKGICTGYNSLVTYSENFLKTIFKPIVDDCSPAINNQLNYKSKLLDDKLKFDPSAHRVICVDVVSNMWGKLPDTKKIDENTLIWLMV